MNEFLKRKDVRIFLTLLLVAAAVWIFAEIAEEVAEGETKSFDKSIILMFRQNDNPELLKGPYWVNETVRDITALGSGPVLFLFILFITVYLLLVKEWGKALHLAGASVTGALLVTFLKDIFSRQRPPGIYHLASETSLSFPSGHSAMSAVVYLTLALILSYYIRRKYLRLYIVAIAILMAGMVGLSRVMLGMHYPTDVAAGWAFGFAWALLSRLVLYYLEREKSPVNTSMLDE